MLGRQVTRFRAMCAEHGAVQATKRLIHAQRPSDSRSSGKRALDLTVEAVILRRAPLPGRGMRRSESERAGPTSTTRSTATCSSPSTAEKTDTGARDAGPAVREGRRRPRRLDSADPPSARRIGADERGGVDRGQLGVEAVAYKRGRDVVAGGRWRGRRRGPPPRAVGGPRSRAPAARR